MAWFWWSFQVGLGFGLGLLLVLVVVHFLIEIRDRFDEWLYHRDSKGE